MEGQSRRYDARKAILGMRRVGSNPLHGQIHDLNGKPMGIVIKISSERLNEVLPQLFCNKVILAFARSYASTQEKSWIKAFNHLSPTQPTFVESLLNFLFVVSMDFGIRGKMREELAVEDYHKADGRFITINLY